MIGREFKAVLRIASIFAALGVFPGLAKCQWRLVSTFPNSIVAVAWGDPAYVLTTDRVYRSTDYGNNWEPSAEQIYATDIAVKDEKTAWLASSKGCFRTMNAGTSWQQITTNISKAILYHREGGFLLLSSWLMQPSRLSTDDGMSWSDLTIRNRNGAAFLSPLEGICAKVFGDANYLARTTDGGKTWIEIPFEEECWQPCAIPSRGTYLMATEGIDKIYQSKDKGLSWKLISSPESQELTGTIRADSCNNVYLQSEKSGVWKSSDLGQNWLVLGGPSNDEDTRFYLGDRQLIAGSIYYDSSKSSGLWQYVGPPLALTIPDRLMFDICRDTSFSLNYNFADFCVGAYAEVRDARISGSSSFEIKGDFASHEIRSPQDVSVTFRPIPGQRDTTRLTLTFWTGNTTFDTTITFIGHGSAQQSVDLALIANKTMVANDEVVVVNVNPDKAINNANLNSLDFNLEYYDDVFRLIDAPSSVGAVVGQGQRVGDKLILPVSLSGNNLSLDPSQPILQLHLASRLADSIHTNIAMSGLKLNGGDKDYENCTLSASSTSASVTVALNCGDETIQRVVRGEKAIAIRSINPNPTNGSITIEYESKLDGAVTLTVYSLSGVLVHEEVIAGKAVQLDASGWASGAYTIVLKAGDKEARASVIKN